VVPQALVLALGVHSCWHHRGAAHQQHPPLQPLRYSLIDTGGTPVALHTRRSPLPPPGLSHPGHRCHLTRPPKASIIFGGAVCLLSAHVGRLFPSVRAGRFSTLEHDGQALQGQIAALQPDRQLSSSPVAVTGGTSSHLKVSTPLLRRIPRRHPMGYRQALLRQRVADDCAGIPAAGGVRFLSDVPEELGPSHLVSQRHTVDLSGGWLPVHRHQLEIGRAVERLSQEWLAAVPGVARLATSPPGGRLSHRRRRNCRGGHRERHRGRRHLGPGPARRPDGTPSRHGQLNETAPCPTRRRGP
jgi:hypothetical protein